MPSAYGQRVLGVTFSWRKCVNNDGRCGVASTGWRRGSSSEEQLSRTQRLQEAQSWWQWGRRELTLGQRLTFWVGLSSTRCRPREKSPHMTFQDSDLAAAMAYIVESWPCWEKGANIKILPARTIQSPFLMWLCLAAKGITGQPIFRVLCFLWGRSHVWPPYYPRNSVRCSQSAWTANETLQNGLMGSGEGSRRDKEQEPPPSGSPKPRSCRRLDEITKLRGYNINNLKELQGPYCHRFTHHIILRNRQKTGILFLFRKI